MSGNAQDTGAVTAAELVRRIQELAESDPERARDLVGELVTNLDVATDGAFTGRLEQLGPEATS